MKKVFYLPFLLLAVTTTIFAQSPGGVAGSVLWLKANTGFSGSSWTDNSGLGNNFSQATFANQPTLATNVFNFNEALAFDGANSFLERTAPTGFPTDNNDRSIFVVAQANTTTGYRWILAYGNVS